ncbi:hypothetical protein RchiOBHm_Chr3g0477221 [Rosa chinensis]|uniref:Uncharacterized protein n=1 Tax=Rosa chinensis TaxID=74649 RepID=A0A2P6RCV2_ROSCH|nr:hypothetical protein RchiOBHm_Chr3g0477221 [Rosa chinensis]
MLERALQLHAEVFERLLMGIWSIWKNRNSMLWDNTSRPAADLFLSAMTWLDEFNKAQASSEINRSQGIERWQPAHGSLVKINVDGAFCHHLIMEALGA